MVSTSLNTIKVTLKPHPIKEFNIIKEVERKTYREIFESFNLPLPIEYGLIYDGNKIISPDDYDKIPTVNHIYIRLIPEGGAVDAVGDFFVNVGDAIWQGIDAVVGFVVDKTVGFFRWVFGGGSNKRHKQLRSPSIRGSSNPNLKGQRLPILLGKHLVFPAHASSPYTINVIQDDHKSRPRYPDRQRVRQLFCAGTKDMVIESGTAKVGDTLVSNITQAVVEFRQAGESLTVYGDRHFMTTVNKPMTANSPDSEEAIIVTTPTNTETIRLNFIASSGIGKPNDNKLNKITVGDVVFIKDVDSAGDFIQLGRHEEHGASYHTFRWEHNFTNANTVAPSTKRQWTLKVVRSHRMDEDSNRRDRFNFESMVCTTADFVSDPIDRKPVSDTTRAKLTLIEAQFNATNLIQGTVEKFNFVATLSTYIYTGTGGQTGPTYWTTQAATTNPSACFLYMLRDSYATQFPASDDQIDWPSFEEWYTFCANNSFECNIYFNDEVTIKDILEQICRLGRASWTMIDGKFTIVIDQENTTITQYFTARNTSNFQGERSFTDVITGCRVKFTNPEALYEEAERLVYYDNYEGEPRPSDIMQDLEVPAAITPGQAVKMGRYYIASNRLRPERFTFDVDIEYIFCTRGDRVQINHDVPLLGLASGRIESVEETGGNTVSLTSDELLTYENGKDYGIKVRKFDNTVVDINLTNQASAQNPTVTSYAMEFETPQSGTDLYEVDELFMFGERDSETLDLIVMHIQSNADLSATLLCVEYNEDVYDEGIIPAYNPKISLSADSSGPLNVTNTPSVDDYNAANTTESILSSQLADMVNRSLTAYVQDGDQQIEVTGYKPVFLDAETFLYINYSDGNTVYRKTITDSQDNAGTQIITTPTEHMVLVGIDTLIYVNVNDESKLYTKDLQTSGNGTALTTVSARQPVTDDEGNIFYINVDDANTVYKTDVDSTNGTQLTTFNVQTMIHNRDGEIVYIKPSDGQVWKKPDDDGTEGSLLMSVSGGVQSLEHLDDTHYMYISNRDHTLFRNTYANTDTTDFGEALFELVSSVGGFFGNILFSTERTNLEEPGVIYYSGINRARREPHIVLKPQVESIQFRAGIVNGSFYVRDIPADSINVITVNDIITGTGIPADARVRYVGTDYVSLSLAASITDSNALLQSYGDRLYIDANKVIASGSIEARHLRASAIDSKAYTSTGERISEYDLDNGTQTLRKSDGLVVWDLDPNRTGSELLFSGNISGTAVGSDGKNVPTSTDLTNIGAIVRQQEDGEIEITISDTAPTSPDEGDIWQDSSQSPAVLYAYHSGVWINATAAEESAFELAQANGSLLDKTASVFAPTPNPTDYVINDLWIRYDTKYSYRVSSANSSTYMSMHWESTAFNEFVSQSAVDIINAETDNYVTYFESSSTPSGAVENDLWYDLNNGTFKRYSGGFFSIASTMFTPIFRAASQAQTQDGGKIFALDTEPTNYIVGDLWIEARTQTTTTTYRAITTSATFDEAHWTKSQTAVIDEEQLDNVTITNGRLSIESDDHNRLIEIGNEGLLVRDSNEEIIHDIPDVALASQFYVGGHLYFTNGEIRLGGASGDYRNSQIVTGNMTVQTGGNSNVKAVMINVDFTIRKRVEDPYSNELAAILRFDPTNAAWGNGATFYLRISGNSVFDTLRRSQTMILPVGENNQITWTLNAGSTEITHYRFVVYQSGFFV